MSRSTSGKSTSHKKKEEKERKSSESRKYAQIQSDSIVLYSDSIVDKIGDDIVRPLAEDVSYRLRELIHACSTYLAEANRSCLTTEDVNQVLHTKEIPPVYGHAGKGQIRFTYIDEANIFVEDDPEIDIIQLAISNIGITQKGKHFIKSMWLLPSLNSGPIESELHMQEEEMDIEESIPLSDGLINYYKYAYRILYGKSKKLFQVLKSDFRSNVKFGPVVPHIIEALIQALEEADKVGERRFWLLDAIDALADNEAVDLSPLLCVNSLVTCLIHCALDFHATDRGFSFSVDEDFRLKTALILSKVLQRWSGAVIVREVLLRLSSILKDLRIPLPVHRGALHVLTAMGQAPLALCLWPLLLPSEKYAYFLNTIQSVEEVIIDFEAIKNIILCGAETLLPKERGQSDEEKGEVPCIINPTSAELEQEDLARKVQPVLYDIFGDAVCCRWPLPVISPQVSHPRLERYTNPRHCRQRILNRKVPVNINEAFEEKAASLQSISVTVLSGYSLLNLGGHSFMQRQCKVRRQSNGHTIFSSHSPYQSLCSAFLWTGRINQTMQGTVISCANLKTIL